MIVFMKAKEGNILNSGSEINDPRDPSLDIITIRPDTKTDEPFIYSTWLKGLYYGSQFYGLIPTQIYYEKYHNIIEAILGLADVEVRIACLAEEPDVIVGYSVLEKKPDSYTLHWVFVKDRWRKLGLAKKLCSENIREYSHLTNQGKAVKPKHWIFNPFLV